MRIGELAKHPGEDFADILNAGHFVEGILEVGIFCIVEAEILDAIRRERFIEMQQSIDPSLIDDDHSPVNR